MKPRNFKPFRAHTSIATTMAAVLTLFTAPFALAATLYWDGGSVDILTNGNGASAGGNGTWNTTILNWDAGASPHVAWTNGTDTAEINGGTQGITLGTNITVGRINQKAGSSGATITEGAGPYSITLGSATTIFNVAASVTAGRTLNVNAVVTGSNNLSIQGPTTTAGGAVNLNRINTFTGTLSIDDTNLRIGNGPTAAQLNSGNYTGAISITSTATFTYASSLDQTLGGVISGSGTLTKNSADSTLTLTNASTYSGNTTVARGTLKAGANNVLPSGAGKSNIAVNAGASSAGTLDLNGFNLSINGLAGTAAAVLGSVVNNATATDKTLTIGNGNAAATFAGIIADNTSGTGTIALIKVGTGTQTLSGPNTYTGTTTISAGKLLGGVGGNCANSEVIIGDASATGGVSITDNTLSWTGKALTASAAGGLEFDFGIVTPSISVSPLSITNLANFTTATPTVSVVVSTGLAPGTYPLMTWGSISGTAPTTAGLSVSTMAAETTASLGVSGNTLNLIITSTPAIVKANNTNNLNLGTSWVGNVAPSSSDVAKWNSTVTTANTTALGADLTWAGIAIENPSGLVTINGTNTLTLGAATTDIDLSTANTADLTLNCPLTLDAANVWDVAASRSLTLGGQVSGAFGVTKLGAGTATLSSSANSYTGNTTVTAGTVLLGANNVIPHGAGGVAGNVVVNGTLDLNGKSDSINGLSGSGVVDNTGAAASTLSVGNNAQTSTFSGVIKSTTGNVNPNKTGGGTLTLSGANTFTGATSVIAGTLALGNASALGNTTGISLSGGATLSPSLTGINITAAITLGSTGTTATITAPNVAGSGTTNFPVTLSGAIGGAGAVNFSGVSATNAYGVINLDAASDYAGSTLITTVSGYGGGAPNNANIFMNLGVENALPVTTVVTLDGGDGGGSSPGRFCELDLNGNNQTLAGLTNVTGRTLRVQRVVNNSATAATLTVNNTVPSDYSGQLGWVSGYGSAAYNNFGLAKSGSGTFTLSGAAKTYTGTTAITGGTLALGASNVLPDATAVSIGGGTLSIGPAFTDTVGALALTSAATINLGDNTSALVFADSSLETWSGPLNLTGSFVSGASLRFGDGTGTGLTPAQLASISATGFTGFALNGTGFLTATPSAGGFSAWITGTFANGSVPGDQQGPNDDFDKDGISNLVEYAIAGQDPTLSNASIGSFTAGTLSFTKRDATSGLTYAIQESTDLGLADDWTEVTGGTYVNDATTIAYTLTPGTPAKNFARLKVISN
jgi:fibronectin-binding autotransporter adhesin